MADFLAVTEINVGARRSNNCRPRILREEKMTEFRFRVFTLDWKLGIDPNRRAVGVHVLVDRKRAPRRERHALRAYAFVLRIQRRFLKEHERTVLAAQFLAFF